MDYLKYDLCSYERMGDQIVAYRKMYDASAYCLRPLPVRNAKGWEWAASVGGNLWRTDDDIRNNYFSIAELGFGQAGLERFAGPGHWNDPDMLEIGNGGMTEDESRTHMSRWCILAAPLIAGNNLVTMGPETVAMLTNPEVIAVDQDAPGVQGRRVTQEGPLEVWTKPLAEGSKAVGLFNRGWGAMPVTVTFGDVGLGDSANVRSFGREKICGDSRFRMPHSFPDTA